MAFNIKKHGYY